jgi:RimJ/RimL family protein N-acetyltransferase
MGNGSVPVIETARLRLRGHIPEDFAASCALWADPRVTFHITPKPLTPEDVWSRLLRYAGHWQWLGFGFWAVEEKASKHFVGEMGFADYRREIEPPLGDVPELGYVLASQFHGKGYAREAVSAIVAWGDEHFQKARTVCLVSPDNHISLRVAERCGYRELRECIYKGQPTVLLQRFGEGQTWADRGRFW